MGAALIYADRRIDRQTERMAKVTGAYASDHAKASKTESSFITRSVFYLTNTSLVFFCRRIITLDFNVGAM